MKYEPKVGILYIYIYIYIDILYWNYKDAEIGVITFFVFSDSSEKALLIETKLFFIK